MLRKAAVLKRICDRQRAQTAEIECGTLSEDGAGEICYFLYWYLHHREEMEYEEAIKEFKDVNVRIDEVDEEFDFSFIEIKGTKGYLKRQINNIISDIEKKTGYKLKRDNGLCKDLVIEFSDKLKCRKRGQANLIDIVKKIKELNELHPLDERIMEAISDENDIQRINEWLCEWMGSIRDIHDEDENVQSLVDEIISAYDSLNVTILLGEFDAKEMKIILYRNNILLNLNGPYWAKVESVFAHELFHAYHYAARKEHGHNEPENEIVSESLAKYYEHSYFYYLCERGYNKLWEQEAKYFQEDIRHELKKYTMDEWPYSGAIYIAGMHEQWSEFNVFANLFYNSVFSKKGTAIKLLRNMNEMITHKNQNHC